LLALLQVALTNQIVLSTKYKNRDNQRRDYTTKGATQLASRRLTSTFGDSDRLRELSLQVSHHLYARFLLLVLLL
jgi:hypothetical protein